MLNATGSQASFSTGVITTIAGTGTASTSTTATNGDGGVPTAATLNFPEGAASDGLGNLYVADANNNRIRRIDLINNIITTVAGAGTHDTSGGNANNNGAHCERWECWCGTKHRLYSNDWLHRDRYPPAVQFNS